jgi:hypothetical protein
MYQIEHLVLREEGVKAVNRGDVNVIDDEQGARSEVWVDEILFELWKRICVRPIEHSEIDRAAKNECGQCAAWARQRSAFDPRGEGGIGWNT